MHYIAWTLIAMFGYALMLILLKFSLRTIPPEVAVIITNTLLVVAAIGYAIFRGASLTENIGWNQNTMLLVLCGMALSVAIISQYIALSRGPVSVVGPLFGMNVAVVAVLGFIVLREPISVQKIVGVIMAAGAIFLLAR